MSALLSTSASAAATTRGFLELTTWRLHNSDEGQSKRVAAFRDFLVKESKDWKY